MKKRRRARPGEFVTLEEIVAFAAPECTACLGNGFRGVLNETSICSCAREHFLDANVFRIWADPDRDALRWGPNPPTADELREAGRRSGQGGWAQFTKDVTPEKKPA